MEEGAPVVFAFSVFTGSLFCRFEMHVCAQSLSRWPLTTITTTAILQQSHLGRFFVRACTYSSLQFLFCFFVFFLLVYVCRVWV
jgi:uncharacterized membrane protein